MPQQLPMQMDANILSSHTSDAGTQGKTAVQGLLMHGSALCA